MILICLPHRCDVQQDDASAALQKTDGFILMTRLARGNAADYTNPNACI